MSAPPRRRANYAGRAEQPPLTVRLNEEERESLAQKSRAAGIGPPPGATEDDGPNLSEGARRAIAAWTPESAEPAPPAPAPGRKRVSVNG